MGRTAESLFSRPCGSGQDTALPRAVTLVGEAGIGKSRLAREFLGALDATVVTGRCRLRRGITYSPAVEVVKQRLRGRQSRCRCGDRLAPRGDVAGAADEIALPQAPPRSRGRAAARACSTTSSAGETPRPVSTSRSCSPARPCSSSVSPGPVRAAPRRLADHASAGAAPGRRGRPADPGDDRGRASRPTAGRRRQPARRGDGRSRRRGRCRRRGAAVVEGVARRAPEQLELDERRVLERAAVEGESIGAVQMLGA